MGRITFLSSAVVVAALMWAPTAASAEQRARGAAPSRGVAVTRVAPRRVIVAPRVVVSPYRFVRPYYAFRPRVSLGLGLWVGYPVAFPAYYAGYPYPYPYAYPYPAYPYPPAPYAYPPPPANPPANYPAAGAPPPGTVSVQPGAANDGGISFEITPSDAEVYVDGVNVGRVSDFGPTWQPLSVSPGRHQIEIRRAGYQTLAFDADVHAGMVIPYQGTMQRQ
jgi:hypothetical protein